MLRKLSIALVVFAAMTALLVAASFWALSPPAYADPKALGFTGRTPGSVIAVERLTGYNRLVLGGLLWWADLPIEAPVSGDLYHAGFSQGVRPTAVVQRDLEQAPIASVTIRAAAAISGAFDLVRVSVPYAFAHNHSLYLGYLAVSYAAQYQQPLGTLLNDNYANSLPDRNHSLDAIAAALPAYPREQLRPEVLAEIEGGKPSWFANGHAANEAFRWAPKAPPRLYYGDKDTDVSPQDSKQFQAVSAALGGNITLMSQGSCAHSSTALRAVPRARLWLDELSKH